LAGSRVAFDADFVATAFFPFTDESRCRVDFAAGRLTTGFGADLAAGFGAGFATFFAAGFAAAFAAGFAAGFAADFAAGFAAVFAGAFAADFPADFAAGFVDGALFLPACGPLGFETCFAAGFGDGFVCVTGLAARLAGAFATLVVPTFCPFPDADGDFEGRSTTRLFTCFGAEFLIESLGTWKIRAEGDSAPERYEA
jgi:hypothetical protein